MEKHSRQYLRMVVTIPFSRMDEPEYGYFHLHRVEKDASGSEKVKWVVEMESDGTLKEFDTTQIRFLSEEENREHYLERLHEYSRNRNKQSQLI